MTKEHQPRVDLSGGIAPGHQRLPMAPAPRKVKTGSIAGAETSQVAQKRHAANKRRALIARQVIRSKAK